jgi:hypothetical protein
MCCINGSKLRHPAGKLRKTAEASPHSLGWALGKAMQLGRLKALLEVSNLVEAELARVSDGVFDAKGVLRDLQKKIEELAE